MRSAKRRTGTARGAWGGCLMVLLSVLAPGAVSAEDAPAAEAPPASIALPDSLDTLASRYVQLVLSMGVADPGYVDAWDGPAVWLEDAREQPHEPLQLAEQARELRRLLSEHPQTGDPEAETRSRYLQAQLDALSARGLLLSGRHLDFDAEARALYGVSAPRSSEAELQPILAELNRLLPPGPGSLADRYARFIATYTVSREHLQAVVQAAVDAARAATRAQLALPTGERFEVVLVDTRPWAFNNQYLGDYHSRLEIDADRQLDFARIVDLAAHEGYPGHHLTAVLREQHRQETPQPIEQRVRALYSPQTLLDEGAAEAGIGLAFPDEARRALLGRLFVLAGFRLRTLDTYDRVTRLVAQLAVAQIEAARRYLDGNDDAETIQAWLSKYTLASSERAAERIDYFRRYRSYVVTYTAGRQLVERYLDSRGGGSDEVAARWRWFAALVLSPRAPVDLMP